MGKKGRIESLQIVRGIAFLLLYLFHAFRTFPGEGRIYRFFATGLGPWGVSVFFVLSGFLMVYSYWDRPPQAALMSSARFALNKIAKLYPLHIIMLLVGAIRLLLHHQSIALIARWLLITVPLLQTWFPDDYQALNSVAWYLSVSLFLYFAFPLLLSFMKNGSAWQTAGKIFVIYLIQYFLGLYVIKYTSLNVKWITYCHPVYRLGDFMIGGLTASLFIKCKKPGRSLTCSLLETAAVITNFIVCFFYPRIAHRAQWFAYTCLFIPTTVLLVYSFALDKGILSRLLKTKTILWLAAISPYGFLIHRLVIHYFHDYCKYILDREQVSFVFVITIPFIITVGMTYLYLAVQKHTKDRNKTGSQQKI